MLARLRHRLETAIPRAADPAAAGRLRGELACLLARYGDLDRARKEVATLRAEFHHQPEIGVSAWLALTEGLIAYYADLDTGCRDKLLRAHSLSAAARLHSLQALSAAWLALLDYVEHDGDSMAQRLRHAFDLSAPDDHGVRARACVVAGQAYHWGGRLDRAQPWYDRARHHALAEGDDAMMSAILFNRSAIQMNLQREAEAQGVVGLGVPTASGALARQSGEVLMGAESTERFDQMVGATSLSVLHPLLRAQILTIHGQADEALALFEQHYAAGMTQGMAGRVALLRADMARCEALRTQVARALELAREAEDGLDSLEDLEDRAATRCRLIQVYDSCGGAAERALALSHRELAASHWQTHLSQQARWVERLDTVLGPSVAAQRALGPRLAG